MRRRLNAIASRPNLAIEPRAMLAAAVGQIALTASMYVLANLGVLTHDEFGFPVDAGSVVLRVLALAWGAACLSWFPSRAATRMVPWLGLRHVIAVGTSLVMCMIVEMLCWVGQMVV